MRPAARSARRRMIVVPGGHSVIVRCTRRRSAARRSIVGTAGSGPWWRVRLVVSGELPLDEGVDHGLVGAFDHHRAGTDLIGDETDTGDDLLRLDCHDHRPIGGRCLSKTLLFVEVRKGAAGFAERIRFHLPST
jgi:hypothetical protein